MREFISTFIKDMKRISSVIGGLAFLIGIFFVVDAYINSQIEKKISDPAFMREIREELMPFVIFDDKGRILADSGGMKFLKEDGIQVISHDAGVGVGVPAKILISPKEFLPIAPLLTSLDADRVDIEEQRGQGFDWEYTLTSRVIFGDPLETVRFRLEFLR